MDSENKFERHEIPQLLYNSISNSPIERCIECDKYLLEEASDYFIEKAFKKFPEYKASEVIFEYAICNGCAEKMRKKMSRESIQHLENYFVNQINPENLITNESGVPTHCAIKGTSLDSLNEYQIIAHCTGRLINTKWGI